MDNIWFVTKEQYEMIKKLHPELIDNTMSKKLYGVKIYETGE